MKKTIIIIILIAVFSSAFAQNDIDRELQLARKYILLQKFEDAQDILEMLYMENPRHSRVLHSLKEVYFGLGEHEKLMDILTNQAVQEPNNAQVRIDLGKLALVMNDVDQAMEYFEKAFALYPKNENYYRLAFTELLQRGYLEETREVIKSARKSIGNDNLYALDMAMTYELEGVFDESMTEYGKYLVEHPDRFHQIERRIDIAGRTEEELEQLEKSIKRMFDKNTLSERRIYQLLSRVNIRTGNYSAALENLVSASKNTKPDRIGELVYPFAMQMLDQGHYDSAIEAGEYLRDTKGPYSERGELIMAKALVAKDDFDKAYDVFVKLQDSRISEVAIEANLSIAAIDIDNDKLAPARERLDGVIRNSNPQFMQAALKLYTASYLKENKLEEAAKILDKHSIQFKNSPWYIFQTGEIELFRGNYEDAEKVFKDMASKAPDDDNTNDAIDYMMLLSKKDDGNFGDLIEAIRLWKSGKGEEAIENLDDLAGKDSQLDLEINWYLGEFSLLMDKLDKARASFEKIVDRYPESFQVPLALEYIGDIEKMEENDQSAYEFYQKVLTKYPDAINIVRVREKARDTGGI